MNLRRRIEQCLAEHSEMLKLLANQQMDIALQKFESEVAPKLQDIAAAAKRMIEMQSKDLEQMSGDASRASASTNIFMAALVGFSLVAGLVVLGTLRKGTTALRSLTGEINVCATEVAEASKQISGQASRFPSARPARRVHSKKHRRPARK